MFRGELPLPEVILSIMKVQRAVPWIDPLLLLLLLLTAVVFSPGGSSPYTSTDKTNNIHKRNNTKTQYKQYKTQ